MPGLMSMALILLVLFSMLHNCLGTKCYTCQSDSIEGCFTTQDPTICTKDEQCVTMGSADVVQTKAGIRKVKKVHMFHKFCQHKKFKCNKKCDAIRLGGLHCRAACCDYDFCNKEPVKRKVVGSKRNDSGVVNDTSSSQIISISTQLFLGLLVIWLFILQ